MLVNTTPYDRQKAVAQQYFSAEMMENLNVKAIIRDYKLRFLDHLLDNVYHRRYWVISFHEEWVDAEMEPGNYPYPARPGDKIFKLYGSISEVQKEPIIMPVIDTENMWEIPNVKHAQTFYQKAKWRLWKWAHRGESC